MDLFFRGSHTTNFVTCGFNRSYNQAADVPSSKVTCKSPRRPSINCRIMLAFVSMTHSITTLPTEFLTAAEILSLCTSIPIYLMLLVIKGVLSGRVEPNTQNLLQGAPFYIASPNRSARCCRAPVSFRGAIVKHRVRASLCANGRGPRSGGAASSSGDAADSAAACGRRGPRGNRRKVITP